MHTQLSMAHFLVDNLIWASILYNQEHLLVYIRGWILITQEHLLVECGWDNYQIHIILIRGCHPNSYSYPTLIDMDVGLISSTT
jgi:hypothetical protein